MIALDAGAASPPCSFGTGGRFGLAAEPTRVNKVRIEFVAKEEEGGEEAKEQEQAAK